MRVNNCMVPARDSIFHATCAGPFADFELALLCLRERLARVGFRLANVANLAIVRVEIIMASPGRLGAGRSCCCRLVIALLHGLDMVTRHNGTLADT